MTRSDASTWAEPMTWDLSLCLPAALCFLQLKGETPLIPGLRVKSSPRSRQTGLNRSKL